MELVGYVVKIGNFYFRSKINDDYLICKTFEGAMTSATINYAKKIAEETGGVIKRVYISDQKPDKKY